MSPLALEDIWEEPKPVRISPIALPRAEAAHFMRMRVGEFQAAVDRGKLPKPVDLGEGNWRWRREDLECARWGCQRGESVYFLCVDAGRFVKIGQTKDLPKRLKALQIGNPEQLIPILTLRGNAQLERRFHRALKDYRAEGEWFEARDGWLDAILTMANKRDARRRIFEWLEDRGA